MARRAAAPIPIVGKGATDVLTGGAQAPTSVSLQGMDAQVGRTTLAHRGPGGYQCCKLSLD